MNQKCPSCGNYVEGKRRQSYTKKVTKTGVKSIVNGAASVGAASTGAAIGSAIFPGVGTAVGAAVGFVASAMFHTAVNEGVDQIVDIAEENISDIVYEFICPKCGKKWNRKVNLNKKDINNVKGSCSNSNSSGYSQTSNCVDNNFDWQAKFFEDYQCYFDDRDEILSTKESVKDFINELLSDVQDCEDFEIRGHYHFFISLVCLQYSLCNLNDNLFDFALPYIEQALSNNPNEEYLLLFNILAIAKSSPNEDLIFGLLEIVDIESVETELVNTEYWKIVFEIILHNKIVNDFLPFYEKTNEHAKLLNLLFAYSFEDIGYKISVCNMISDAYEGLGDHSKQFEYIKSAVELADFENEFDPNDPDHSYWLIALENLGYCYIEGVGVPKDTVKALEIYTKCAKLGSDIAMRNIGDIYENGEAVEQNYSVALDWYNKALTAGYEEAEEDVKRVLEKLGVEKRGSGVYIPQKEEFYMNIEDVFEVKDRGVVIVGQVKTGYIDAGDKIILTNYDNSSKICQITGIEMFRKLLDRCEFGDNVGLLLKGIDNKDEIRKGAYVKYYDGECPVGSYIQDCSEVSSVNEITSTEREYLEEIKACIEEDGEISVKERRLLERLREKLGISSERATELEATLSAPQLTNEEKEYLEEYKACLEDDGEISPKERRLLNHLRDTLGISEERALEIEKL